MMVDPSVPQGNDLAPEMARHEIEHQIDGEEEGVEDEEYFDPYVFIHNLPPLTEVVPPVRPTLLPRQTRSQGNRKTLVLDLDETLVRRCAARTGWFGGPEQSDQRAPPVLVPGRYTHVWTARRGARASSQTSPSRSASTSRRTRSTSSRGRTSSSSWSGCRSSMRQGPRLAGMRGAAAHVGACGSSATASGPSPGAQLRCSLANRCSGSLSRRRRS